MDSVHWKFPGPGESDVFTVDAKQRHLVIVEYPEDKIRMCAEAAPDAFSAFGNSFSFKGLFGATSNDVQAANAFASTAATIERTQTVNLLREMLYRTCELWLSDALTKQEFLVRAARDHRTVVSLLAIEQLTGVVKPPATVISGPAVTAAASQSEELVELLGKYREERVAADKQLVSAQEAFDKANVIFPEKEPEVASEEGGSADEAGDKEKVERKRICEYTSAPEGGETKYTECKEAEAKLAEAKEAQKGAASRETSVLNQLAALSGGLAAATTGGKSNFGGFESKIHELTDVQTAIIARAVEKIALTAGIDEALVFCTSYLLKDGTIAGNPTTRTCNRVLLARAAQDQATIANIAGAPSADVKDILQYSESAEIQAENILFQARYTVMVEKLKILISTTPSEQWDERWTQFAETANDVGLECPTRADCIKYIETPENFPFQAKFSSNTDAYEKGVEEWEAANKAAVEEAEKKKQAAKDQASKDKETKSE